MLDLSRTVKFEDMHVLTREEIVRFGIDRREFVGDLVDIREQRAHGTVRKVAVQRIPARNLPHHAMAADLFRQRALRAGLQRPATVNPTFSSVAIGGGGTPQDFSYPPAKASGFELWGMRMAKASVQSLLDLAQVEFMKYVGCRGRAQHSAIHETLQRRIVGCAG